MTDSEGSCIQGVAGSCGLSRGDVIGEFEALWLIRKKSLLIIASEKLMRMKKVVFCLYKHRVSAQIVERGE